MTANSVGCARIAIGRYGGDPQTLSIIEQVLRKAGVDFIDENGGGLGVRLAGVRTT